MMWFQVILLGVVLQQGWCGCFFPVEFQGMFATQSTITPQGDHKYSTVTILPDAIPTWGVCQKKEGHNVVLFDNSHGIRCMKCFHIVLRSPNVVQIHTESSGSCYLSEAEAMASCPTLLDITSRRARQIMLYKSRSFTEQGSIERLACPINGQFHFTYNIDDGTEDVRECPQSTSALANCPRSSELQIRFQRCTFGDVEMSLRCLGNWKGHDGQNYLALWDPTLEKDDKPRYRCAMYDIDEITGVVRLSFSADATCTNGLHSPWEGFETMVLTPLLVQQSPSAQKAHACTFPDWARGKWQDLEILRTDVVLKDGSEDKIYHMECLSQHAPHGERYALFARDQCGRDEFTCIWIKKRDVNVIEFQISKYPSDHYNATQICADDVFLGQDWKTEGRLMHHEMPSCPIQGEHTGVIPDAPELCARLVSDCTYPEKMLYTVYSCANESQVYEVNTTMPVIATMSPQRGRRQAVFRIKDISKLLSRHGHARQNQEPTTTTMDPLRIFDFIHELTAQALSKDKASATPMYRNSSAGFLDGLRQASFYGTSNLSLLGSFAESQSTLANKSFLEGSISNQAVGLKFDESPVNLATIAYPQYAHLNEPKIEKAASTRLPLPHEKPFYRVVSPTYRQPFEFDASQFAGVVLVEDREYRCLGRWSEGGVVYTYTHRVDVDTYECFAGVVLDSRELFIIEAGRSCQRGLQPLANGMKLTQRASCEELKKRTPPPQTSTSVPALDSTTATQPPWWRNSPKNPWLKKTVNPTKKPFWRETDPSVSHACTSSIALTSLLFACLLASFLSQKVAR